MKIGTIVLILVVLFANVARTVRAETLEQEQAAQDLRDAEAAGKRHRAELMKIPHVTVVTGEIDGRNEAAILIEVDDQKNVDAVMRQLPSKIEGFPVEVDEGAPATQNEDGYLHGAPASPIPPTIDKHGYYHHVWIKKSDAAANPAAKP